MIDLSTMTRDNVLLFDGAMGTMLQKQGSQPRQGSQPGRGSQPGQGLQPGEPPELLNLTSPELVTGIHREYVRAGANVVTANTFQAHALKLKDPNLAKAAVRAGVGCARASGARFVALDVGPLGQLMAPMGDVGFERAYEIFRAQVIAGAEAGADLIVVETLSDLYEAKAAVLAAKENTALPVVCTMTFQEGGRTFLGCDALTATLFLQDLGVDALGVNCSLGPEPLRPIVETMLRHARVPVAVQANAGLPVIRAGQPVYEIGPEAYAAHAADMVRQGVRIVGGCCGTTPEYICRIREQTRGMRPVPANPQRVSACTSGTRTVLLGGAAEIGALKNAAGAEALQRALRAGGVDALVDEAITQAQEGARVLHVAIDGPAAMAEAVRAIQGATGAPLLIDSADPSAIEAGARAYNGKPLIRCYDGSAEALARILSIAKKYGALAVAFAPEANGAPAPESRLAFGRRIRDMAASLDVPEENLLVG